MKSIIAILAFVVTSSVFACTNFTGTYESYSAENGRSEYTISQIGCEKISIIDNESSMTLPTNGQDVLIDTKGYGDMVVTSYANARFGKTEFFLTIKVVATMGSETQAFEIPSKIELDANGDLMTETTQIDGTVSRSLDRRIR